MIDLRSDTVTRPTRAMRQAMAEAEVGDDVYGEDPSVSLLDEEVAATLGKPAALFVTSGTMGNQLAIACQTRPGDEVIVGEGAHPVWYESGAGAALSGVQFAIAGRGGLYGLAEMLDAIKPRAYVYPRTSLVCIENTHNRAGGRVFPQADVLAVCEGARARGIATHLDGARIWNASVASGLTVREIAEPFDTVSVCFSKGLGAPVGSALVASRETIERARRFRKMWGGGMRQAGVLAAAARYALAHHRGRLVEDHANARTFAERVSVAARASGARVADVETNIVRIDLAPDVDAEAVSLAAREAGLALNASDPRRLRAVTHLDVSTAEVERAAAILSREIARATAEPPRLAGNT
jgi:threonine aldolase